ncbi:MAG: 2-hydroxyacyl-CoA dehydratase [Oscillospiraceae bacterium]|nr:2-hydroxyacyl-CoA dehydratase [Oscillospiraceae bacterium]
MNTSSFPAREKLLAYSAQSDALAWQAKREGRPVAWMSTKFPAELPAAFGLAVCCPESQAAVLGAKGASGPLCEEAHNLGWCADLCSYSRIGLAVASGCPAPGKELPLPDLLLCCTNICGQMLQWYQNMARILNIPLLLFDVPYTAQDAPSPSLLRYLKGQFFHLAHRLEELTGTPWRQEAFDAACQNALASGQSWGRLCALLEAPLCPWDGMELFDYMPVLVNRRCEAATARLLEELAEELAALPPAPRPPAARLMLEGSPCWPHMGQILEPLRRAGVKICADTITPSLSFSYADLDGLNSKKASAHLWT